MRFIVTSAGNHSAAGELFFSIPAQSELSKAAQTVSDICKSRAKALEAARPSVESYLEKELVWMKKEETAFHVLLLKELADWSQQQGFPIMLHSGGIFGSLIAFLLGITSVNPLEFMQYRLYPAQSLVSCADFDFSIAEPLRALMHNHLDRKFGQIVSDSKRSVFHMIRMPGFPVCERIGLLQERTGRHPDISEFDVRVCTRTLHHLAENMNDEMQTEDSEYCKNTLQFLKEWKDVAECDFYTLTRFFAYCHGDFHKQKSLEQFKDPDFFVTREELFSELAAAGMPSDLASCYSKFGISDGGNKRENCRENLDKYPISPAVREYLNNVAYLWPFAAAASRVHLMCTLAWYEIYFPDAVVLVDC